MAKSARSSRTKSNNARLRATVFAPADAARAQRLSERLLAAAKAREEARMQVEREEQVNGDAAREKEGERMELDGEEDKEKSAGSLKKMKGKGSAGRIKRRQTSKHAVVFPSLRKGGGKKAGRISKK
ncbi:unnamed protein product [Tuber melanosporum]|uniref:(Perigord truffle) hypothetical protein n=1 Tax=Tuber melanosporum (strain Mel28) TaxID=656061 RepID=D5GHJ6_TUBMM|nr:uncharacterized protein GSTUM_00007947001 [Tuber melanosporum]CAZ83989.1 unnamed protein product [Tuber melanosporum]